MTSVIRVGREHRCVTSSEFLYKEDRTTRLGAGGSQVLATVSAYDVTWDNRGSCVYAKTAAGESSGDRPSDRYTFGRLKSLIYNTTQYTHMGLW